MRCHIPKEYKEIVLHMSLNEDVNDEDIHCYTGISQRAMPVRQLQETYYKTGEVVRTPLDAGQPHLLDSLDAVVSHPSFLLFCSQ